MSLPFTVTLTERDGAVLYSGTIYSMTPGQAIDYATDMWAAKTAEPRKMQRMIHEVSAKRE